MTREELQRVREWANQKIATGAEPPWAWFQYMKLREDLDQILAGMSASMLQTESLPQSDQRPEKHLRLVESTDQQDNVLRHPSDPPVRLPT